MPWPNRMSFCAWFDNERSLAAKQCEKKGETIHMKLETTLLAWVVEILMKRKHDTEHVLTPDHSDVKPSFELFLFLFFLLWL